MTYKKKLLCLSALVLFLALVYVLSFALDPGRREGRAFALLEPALFDLASGIEIYGPAGASVLTRKNNLWVFSAGEAEFPVKRGRVEDFIAALSRRDVYTRRALSAEGRERLGLAEGRASRIIVRGGAGLPLLDLLLGSGDALGREVYLRRAGEDEIYSGEDRLTYYTDSGPASWYDLRLFRGEAPARGNLFPPEAPGLSAQGVSAAAVQQAEISFAFSASGEEANAEGRPAETYTLRRSGAGWNIPGNEESLLDGPRVEAWLRSVLEAEAGDFAAGPPAPVEGRITLYLGDGGTLSLRVGPPDGQKRRAAGVSGTELAYTLNEWTVKRLFMELSWFIKKEN